MSDIEPNEITTPGVVTDPSQLGDLCENCGTTDSGLPRLPPPCVVDGCSVGALTLDETGGKLGLFAKLRGGLGKPFKKIIRVGCDEVEDCGVLREFWDSDGNCQGLDVDFFGDPPTVNAIDCVDPDTGESLYQNPTRRFKNADGTCSLGSLPFPIQDGDCDVVEACESYYPPPNGATVYENCGPDLCVSLTNRGCYPMRVRPRLSWLGAEVEGPVSIEYQPNIAGEFGKKFPVLSGNGVSCEDTSSAGSGQIDVDGSTTSPSGADSHTHTVPAQTTSGPSHSHSTNCEITGRETDSGSVDFEPVTIEPGETFNMCVTGSLRYDDPDWENSGLVNFGQKITLCAEGASIVNAETISQLEGEA